MQDELRFSAAEANVVVHATEDPDRILASIHNLLRISAERFLRSESEGHYKNRILVLKAILSSSEANELASRISSGISSADREELWRNLELFSDEKGNLYLRLDKQRLCQGRISISSADSLRVKFKPVKRYRPTSNLENYRGLFSSV